MHKSTIERSVSDDSYAVTYWRQEYDRLAVKVPHLRSLRKQLSRIDAHFTTAEGISDVANTKHARAGLKATRRVVQAMYRLLGQPQETPVQKRLKRQKLSL